MNLVTTYLGLRLAHPFIAGASPLAKDLDHARRLEDGGAAAIVLHSLFEEQITAHQTGRIHQMDPTDPRFADLLSSYPADDAYVLNPDDYLEHLRRLKEAVAIPVIGSLNGVTRQAWLKTASGIAQAGADALELNMYELAADPEDSGAAIESRLRDVLRDLKHTLTIPIAMKLSPYFTALAHMARQLDRCRSRTGSCSSTASISPISTLDTLTGRTAGSGSVDQRGVVAPRLEVDRCRCEGRVRLVAGLERRRGPRGRWHQGPARRRRCGAGGLCRPSRWPRRFPDHAEGPRAVDETPPVLVDRRRARPGAFRSSPCRRQRPGARRLSANTSELVRDGLMVRRAVEAVRHRPLRATAHPAIEPGVMSVDVVCEPDSTVFRRDNRRQVEKHNADRRL